MVRLAIHEKGPLTWVSSAFSSVVLTHTPSAHSGSTARRGHVIVVPALIGNAGFPGLALNLATYLGLRLRGTGEKVCFIDADLKRADSGRFLKAYVPYRTNFEIHGGQAPSAAIAFDQSGVPSAVSGNGGNVEA